MQSIGTLPPNARAPISLHSGLGKGAICGDPGDEVRVVDEALPTEGARSMPIGEAPLANRRWPIIGTQYPVAAAYPQPMGRLASR